LLALKKSALKYCIAFPATIQKKKNIFYKKFSIKSSLSFYVQEQVIRLTPSLSYTRWRVRPVQRLTGSGSAVELKDILDTAP